MTQITIDMSEGEYKDLMILMVDDVNSSLDDKIREAYEKEANEIQLGDWVSWNKENKEGQIIRVFMESNEMLFPKDEESGYLKRQCTKLSPELQTLLNKEAS